MPLSLTNSFTHLTYFFLESFCLAQESQNLDARIESLLADNSSEENYFVLVAYNVKAKFRVQI